MKLKLFAMSIGSLFVLAFGLLWLMNEKVHEEQDRAVSERLRTPVVGLTQMIQADIRHLKRSINILAHAQNAKLDWNQFQPFYALAQRSSKQLFADPKGPAAAWSFEKAIEKVPALPAGSEAGVVNLSVRGGTDMIVQWLEQDKEWILWAPKDYLQALLDLQNTSEGTLAVYNANGQVLAHSSSEYIGTSVDSGSTERKVINQKPAVGLLDLSDERGPLRVGYEKPSKTNIVVVRSQVVAELTGRRMRLIGYGAIASLGVLLMAASLLWLYLPDDGAPARPPREAAVDNTAKPVTVVAAPAAASAPPPVAPAGLSPVALKERQKEYERVIGSLGRELRAPVVSILGQSQSILVTNPGEATTQAVESILRETRHLRALVDQLTSFVSEDAVAKKPTKLSGIVAKVLREFEVKFVQQHIKVLKDIRETSEVPMAGDAVEKVIRHLINNAIESMERMPKKEITLRLAEDPESVSFSVQDNGEGIDAKDLEKVFQPFYTTRSSGQKLGMGLAVSKSIVNEHEGRLELTSQRGQGTLAKITFPRPPKRADIGGQNVTLKSEEIVNVPKDLPASPAPATLAVKPASASPTDFDVDQLFELPPANSTLASDTANSEEGELVGLSPEPKPGSQKNAAAEDDSDRTVVMDFVEGQEIMAEAPVQPVDKPSFAPPKKASALEAFRVAIRRPGGRKETNEDLS